MGSATKHRVYLGVNIIWLVVEPYPSEKWWSSSVGMGWFPQYMESHKNPWFHQPIIDWLEVLELDAKRAPTVGTLGWWPMIGMTVTHRIAIQCVPKKTCVPNNLHLVLISGFVPRITRGLEKNTGATWWLIPLSKWVITQVISGLTLLIPFITGVITHLRAVEWATKYKSWQSTSLMQPE